MTNKQENDLINFVCNHYDVKVYHVYSKCKTGNVMEARTVMIWLYRNQFGLDNKEIAFIFKMNESMVCYHLNKVNNNPQYYKDIIEV
jgi:chromosomal replication initiation ATPase DnaA